MKFLADEGVDAPIVDLLRRRSYDITYVAEFAASSPDEWVLKIAKEENRILITSDKDFGDLVFRLQSLHSGVVLLRLSGVPVLQKAQIVESVLREHKNELTDSFTVIQERMIRIRKRQIDH